MRLDKIRLGHVYIGWDGSFRRVTRIDAKIHWRREKLPDEQGPRGGKRSGSCSLSRFGGWTTEEHPDETLTIEKFQLEHIYKFKFSGYVVQLVERKLIGDKVYWHWIPIRNCIRPGDWVTQKYLWEKATYHLGVPPTT